MPEPTVPTQPVATPPIKKGFPVTLVLIAIVVLIGLGNLGNLIGGKGKTAASRSALVARPAAISPQQVKTYEAMQANETKQDTEDRKNQAAAQAQAQAYPGFQSSEVPGPEVDTAAPMTAAQRQAIYGNSPNAPQRTSNASQGHAEAKQRELAARKSGRTLSTATP